MYTQHNNLTAYNRDRDTERNNQPSATVPDQAMSVREILVRFANGLGFDSGKVPVWNSPDEIPDNFQHLDLADQRAYLEMNKRNIERIQTEMQIKEQQEQQQQATPPTP